MLNDPDEPQEPYDPDEPDEPDDFRAWMRRAGKTVGHAVVGLFGVIAQAVEAYNESPGQCAGCHNTFQHKMMRRIVGIPEYKGRWWLTFCADCRQRLYDAYEYDGILREENRRVLAQLKRALDNGLLATLTLDEWIATPDHFGWKCAYCLVGPYEAIEDVVPIVLGGGTTANNCAPSCKSCNSSKGIRHPDDIRESSRSPVAIARVSAYLKTKRPPA